MTEAQRRWREANRDRVRAINQRSYRAHREEILARKKRWRAEHPEACKAKYSAIRELESERHRARKYGLTAAAFRQMVAQQGSRCAICGREQELVVDHCHESNAIRALLCDTCNRGLGFFGEDVERMRAAIRYLERFRDLESPQLRLIYGEGDA